jgi:hypothetical protein
MSAFRMHPADSAKVSVNSSHGEMNPAMVAIASTLATATIQHSVYRMSLRQSTMSPTAPAGKAKRKKGNDDAVWVSATIVALAPSDTMSQDAPTLCMNVPMLDSRSAMKTFRKMGMRRGVQRLLTARTQSTVEALDEQMRLRSNPHRPPMRHA